MWINPPPERKPPRRTLSVQTLTVRAPPPRVDAVDTPATKMEQGEGESEGFVLTELALRFRRTIK